MNQILMKLPVKTQTQKGYVYLSLLLIFALIALAASATMTVAALSQKRLAEEELLSIGLEFQAALISYANATPQGSNRLPRSFQDLLKDTRTTVVKRHLRKIYVDPMTKNLEWGMVRDASDGILGFFSLSTETPIKQANFPAALHWIEGSSSYREWVFSVSN